MIESINQYIYKLNTYKNVFNYSLGETVGLVHRPRHDAKHRLHSSDLVVWKYKKIHKKRSDAQENMHYWRICVGCNKQ